MKLSLRKYKSAANNTSNIILVIKMQNRFLLKIPNSDVNWRTSFKLDKIFRI